MAPLKVLTALDSARTQYYHFKAIIIAGMGLFTDAYDLFCITPVMKIIGRVYYADQSGVVPAGVATASLAIALLGTAIGQIVFGRLGDKAGRRKVYGTALLLMVSSSIGCGFSICTTRTCVIASLCFFRFMLGFGIGGDYPLSATIMSEFANKRTRGRFIAGVFSMQGFGILVSSCVVMAIMTAFERASDKSKLVQDTIPTEADLTWRLILMIGAIPAALTFYWRMMMPETARYTALVEMNVRKATTDMQTVLRDVDFQQDPEEFLPPRPRRTKTPYAFFSRRFLREHGRDLFSCSVSWFLLDVVFYSSNIFQSQIYDSIFNHPPNIYREVLDLAKLQAIIAICSTIPGYFAALFLIDRIGRKPLQVWGFLLMSVFLFAIGIPYDKYWKNHTNAGYIVLYGLTFFFANMGPNTTTFIVPAEMFPARFRSSCHGVAGAVGKAGAIFGVVGFLWASQHTDGERVESGYKRGIGMMATLLILAGVSVLGTVFSAVFMRETKGKSLEEYEVVDEEEEEEEEEGEQSFRNESSLQQGSENGSSERSYRPLQVNNRIQSGRDS